MSTLFIALRTMVFMTGFVALWAWIAVSLRPLDQTWGLEMPARVVSTGVVLMLCGGALALWCAAAFVLLGRGTPAPFDAPRQFVAVGPYRYVRNPMYIGGWLVLAGFGLYLESGTVVLFSLVWLTLVHLLVVRYEEPALQAKFATAYEDYCRRVQRWMPRWPRDVSNPR